MSQEPVKIAIIMEGGLIESIITCGVPVDVLVVDYDIEGADEDRLIELDEDGPAYVTLQSAQSDQGQDRWAMRAFEQFEESQKSC